MRKDAPVLVYKNGPAFERLCQKCARFMKFPKRIKWKENFSGMCKFSKIRCSKCGPVEPNHVGWDGDF